MIEVYNLNTLSDILVGVLIGLLIASLYLVYHERIIQRVKQYQEQMLILGIIGIIAPVVLVICSLFATILTDHDPLIQNPGRPGGLLTGVTLGTLLERKYVSFTTDSITSGTRLIRGLIGLSILIGSYVRLKIMLDLDTGTYLDILLVYFRYTLLTIISLAFTPWIFHRLEENRNSAQK